jgi:hypothetical protein
MGVETLVGVAASLITTMSGLGWLLDRNGRRTDARFDTVIAHMAKVENMLNDMRAEMPIRYTLKEDHLRLQEKLLRVESIVYHYHRRSGDEDES